MADATYNSGSQVDPANSYAPASDTDTCLFWIVASRRAGTNSASTWTFGATSMTEATNSDQSIDIGGGADPASAAAYLANPGTSSQTLDMAWASAVTQEIGFAMTLANVDQTTPESDADGGTYSSTATPSLTVDVPAGGISVYWRHNAQGTDPSWTDPTGYTLRSEIDLITSPAYRTLAIWTREFASQTLSHTVQADSGATADGCHGVVVFAGTGAAGVDTARNLPLIGVG